MDIPRCLKKTSNACSTPWVRLTLEPGTPTEMASVGRMKTNRIRTTDKTIAFGNSLLGRRISVTWTAFISMPA